MNSIEQIRPKFAKTLQYLKSKLRCNYVRGVAYNGEGKELADSFVFAN